MCVDVAWVKGFGGLCWSGFEGGLFGGCLGFGRGVGCLCDYMVLPLLNSSFEPGRAREVVEGFVDVDLRNILRGLSFFILRGRRRSVVRSRGGICPAGLLS